MFKPRKEHKSSERLSDCFAVKQSKSEAGCLCSKKIVFLLLWKTLCMGAMHGGCVHPSQNNPKFQNIQWNTQWNNFFLRIPLVCKLRCQDPLTEMPRSKQSCVIRLGPCQENGNLLWNTCGSKCQKWVMATLSTSYIPISLELIARVEMQHTSLLPMYINTGVVSYPKILP